MKELYINEEILIEIKNNGSLAYPEEGAGFIFGKEKEDKRTALFSYPIQNSRDAKDRHNRYLITPNDMLKGEREAEKLGLDIIGIFHSHPDHPAKPSQFDIDWALPWYSYIITSVENGIAKTSRSWRLLDDRTEFLEENIEIIKLNNIGEIE